MPGNSASVQRNFARDLNENFARFRLFTENFATPTGRIVSPDQEPMNATNIPDIHGVCRHSGGGFAKHERTRNDERRALRAKDGQKQTSISSIEAFTLAGQCGKRVWVTTVVLGDSEERGRQLRGLAASESFDGTLHFEACPSTIMRPNLRPAAPEGYKDQRPNHKTSGQANIIGLADSHSAVGSQQSPTFFQNSLSPPGSSRGPAGPIRVN